MRGEARGRSEKLRLSAAGVAEEKEVTGVAKRFSLRPSANDA